MSDWHHGYVTDLPYTHGFYRECAPNWLDWVALLRGAAPPQDTRRVLELGCGQGFGLCVMAAAHPGHRFVGVDFNPEHIAHARSLVRRTGLTNVEFHDGDFLALAQAPELPWGQCDYLVAHGILSWIGAPIRQALFRIADRCLVPGGLAYLSYNVLPGWLGSHPVQHLMRQFANRGGVNAASFEQALASLQALKDANAAVFAAQPGLTSRLEQLRQLPAAQRNYLFHEYFNDAWTLFYSTQLAAEASAGKLVWLGSATLPDNFDSILPQPARDLLQQAPDPALRELYKDLLLNQSFRRDVFVRGRAPLWSGESAQRLGACPIALLQDPAAASLAFATSAGEVSGRAELYRPLLQALAKGPRPLADLLPAVPGLTLPGALEAVSLLLQSGVVGLHVPEANQKPATRANRALAAAVAQGAPYGFAAAPGIGSGVALTDVQWLALDAQAQGANTLAALAAGVEARLQRLNRALVQDGQPLPYGAATQAELTARLADVPTRILPLLRRLGGWA